MTDWQYRTVTAKWSRTRYVVPDFEGLFEAVMRGDAAPSDSDHGEIDLDKGLDYMGRDGWELATALPNTKNWFTDPKSVTLILKRPAKQERRTTSKRVLPSAKKDDDSRSQSGIGDG